MKALERAYFLLKKLGGGEIRQIIDIYPKKVLPKRIRLDLRYSTRLLGIKIPTEEIKKIFARLEYKIIKYEHPYLTVEIPTFRQDISRSEDLIEEIGRIYGYGKIKSVFPIISLAPPKKNVDIFWENVVKDILKELGFSEIYNYSFFSDKEVKNFGYKKQDLIEVKNPVSRQQKYLRTSLIPNLLKNVQENQKYFKEIKIFELGKIFIKEQRIKNKEQSEKKMLTGMITKQENKEPSEEFYELKGILDSLLIKLGITNVWYDDFQPTPEESKITIWNFKKCAEIKIDQQEIGFLGEINPNLSKKLEISEKVAVFDLDFEKLIKLSTEEQEYRPISPYPAAVRDLAVLIPQDIKVVDVLNVINTTGGKLIRDVDLFDIYTGEELPLGEKNLAFHIIYQAEDRTLTAKEIDKIQQKIVKALERNPGWEVRK